MSGMSGLFQRGAAKRYGRAPILSSRAAAPATAGAGSRHLFATPRDCNPRIAISRSSASVPAGFGEAPKGDFTFMRKSVLALALIAFAVPQMALTGTALPQTQSRQEQRLRKRRRLRAAQPVRRGVRADPPRRGRAGRRQQARADRDLRHAVRPRPALGVSDRGRIQGAAVEGAGGQRLDRARADDGQQPSPRSCRRATARPPPTPTSSPAI